MKKTGIILSTLLILTVFAASEAFPLAVRMMSKHHGPEKAGINSFANDSHAEKLPENHAAGENQQTSLPVFNDLQLYNEIKRHAMQREEKLVLTCGGSYSAEQMKQDTDRLGRSLGIKKFDYIYPITGNSITVHAEYHQSFRICESAADILEYIDQCADSGEPDPNIFISRDYSYQCFRDQNYELDYTLARSRLRYPGDYYFDEETYHVWYSDSLGKAAEYVQTVNPEERMAFMLSDFIRIYEKYTNQLSEKFGIFVSDEVFRQLEAPSQSGRLYMSGEPVTLLSDIMANNGVDSQRKANNNHWIRGENINYMPGKRIAYAYKTNQLEMLHETEREALSIALKLVEGIKGNARDREKKIHDLLCKRIAYQSGDKKFEGGYSNSRRSHSVIGALIDGKGVCNGYADAFYLCCSLAGIEVKYITGNVRTSNGSYGGHMWNLVHLDGQWLVVDATWDSQRGRAGHHYFNIGTRKAAKDHLWDKRALLIDIAK